MCSSHSGDQKITSIWPGTTVHPLPSLVKSHKLGVRKIKFHPLLSTSDLETLGKQSNNLCLFSYSSYSWI